jgi:predicted peptidase
MSDRNKSADVRSWAVLATVWAVLNCALLVTDVIPDGTRESRRPRPAQRVLALFETHKAPHNESVELGHCNLDFRILAPPQTDSRQAFPLLVFLHGAGERGSDNESQLHGLPAQMCLPEWRRRFPCYLLAPQCPAGRNWSEFMSDLEFLSNHACANYHVDARRVYLTGLSMGGHGSWELAARCPEFFAAVVPICGGGSPDWCEALARIPVWAVHGADDDVVPVEESRRMIQGIQHAGGAPRYTELAGVAHDSWSPTYRDPDGVLAWMFNQVNQRRPSPPPRP